MSDTPENVPADLEMQIPTHLASVSIQLHEMFLNLQSAGFTRKESLELVGYAIAAGIMEPYMEDASEGFTFSKEDPDEEEDDNFGDPEGDLT
jgi:hypothetical protein